MRRSAAKGPSMNHVLGFFVSMEVALPFGGYADFAACVAANSDKADPKAYCGAIQAAAEKALKNDAEKRYVIEKADKPMASVDGEEHPAGDFAYVPDPEMPSTWKFPIFDAAHARNALARFDQADLPAADKARVRARIEAAARSHGVEVAGDSQKAFTVTKLDEAQRLVFGWASVSVSKDGAQLEDLQGDVIDPADLENAAYDFVLFSRNFDEMHQGRVKGQLVESLAVTPEKLQAMGLKADTAPQVGWWVGAKFDPESFAKVKAGDYSMFSIECTAVPVEV